MNKLLSDVTVNSGTASIEEAAAGGLAYWLTGFGRRLHVLVIGAHDVGKSVIIRRLIGQELITETAGAEPSESTSSTSFRGLTLTVSADEDLNVLRIFYLDAQTALSSMGGGGGAVVECPTRDRKVPGSIPDGAKK